jgi:hypothetical protein
MSKLALMMVITVSLFAQQPQTLKQLLAQNGVQPTSEISEELLRNFVVEVKRTPRFIYLDSHVNPSAGRLIILSRDFKLAGTFYGWEAATLPDDTIVYHHSQIHLAPTHSLEISVFNPNTRKERQIYPPEPWQPVRRDFIQRVAQIYKQRGAEWFAQHNHHMDPELFDSSLEGEVIVDASSKTFKFIVRFGDPQNANDPLPFSERIQVTCGPIGAIEQIQCREVKFPQ